MAEAATPASLGDFFAKKKKKNIKGSNLNIEAANPKAEEQKKKPTKEKEEEGWEEEQIAVTAMKVEVAGKLTREDDKKEEEDSVAPAWRTRAGGDGGRNDLSDKKYPTLAKAVGQSSNINIDDGSNPTVNIKTTKNAFAALHDNDDEDEAPIRPKEIKPAMVQKQKGERTSAAIQREVEKYSGPADGKKKKDSKKKKEVAEEDEDEDEEEEEAVEEVEDKKKKKKEKKQEEQKEPAKEEVEVDDDVKMQPDLEASRKKYQGRTKLPKTDLPASELEEEKENRPKAQPAASGKKGKKKMFMEEEYDKPKLLVADWD